MGTCLRGRLFFVNVVMEGLLVAPSIEVVLQTIGVEDLPHFMYFPPFIEASLYNGWSKLVCVASVSFVERWDI